MPDARAGKRGAAGSRDLVNSANFKGGRRPAMKRHSLACLPGRSYGPQLLSSWDFPHRPMTGLGKCRNAMDILLSRPGMRAIPSSCQSQSMFGYAVSEPISDDRQQQAAGLHLALRPVRRSRAVALRLGGAQHVSRVQVKVGLITLRNSIYAAASIDELIWRPHCLTKPVCNIQRLSLTGSLIRSIRHPFNSNLLIQTANLHQKRS
jgi:hypothetical protein